MRSERTEEKFLLYLRDFPVQDLLPLTAKSDLVSVGPTPDPRPQTRLQRGGQERRCRKEGRGGRSPGAKGTGRFISWTTPFFTRPPPGTQGCPPTH